uniref:Rab-GAP TBC domain-containing protein n=1 Tax=Dendroctonus ponderosae TaxID=77166 RepID=A0AAR5PBY7_DENPD
MRPLKLLCVLQVTDLYRQMKEQSQGPAPRQSSSAGTLTSLCVAISPSSSNFFEVLYIGKIKEWQKRVPDTFVDDALEKFRLHELEKQRLSAQQRPGSMEDVSGGPTPPVQRSASCHLQLAEELKAAVDTDDHNRTMVLQVDRTDLRLISPDRKVILLHKQHLDVTTCLQGVARADHFGFICQETAPNRMPTYIGYVFKCESSSIAGDAVAAITQAFLNSEPRARPLVTSCEQCPMVWFHRLCADVEHLPDKKTQAAILRRLEQLEADEQMALLGKFRGADAESVREQNEFLMMLLRAHCEAKQARHMHDTAENRTEFLNQYLGGGANVFSKAKKSFDQFLKRRTSTNERQMSLPIAPPSPEGFRSRASSIEGAATPKSPMMDIFRKVGNSPKGAEPGTWRQAIFKRVVAAQQEKEAEPAAARTPRELWRRGIKQAILLIRMEKENERLKARQEESAVKRIKLEYDEMKPSQREVMEVWEMLTNKELHVKCDKPMLLQAIRQGVPRGKRGEVWQFLAEQHCKKSAPPDPQRFPSYNTPYDQLLRQLTAHQHAILIDLGRTFPSHSYFSSPLGPGQLALFNLLKAYSLLDP